MAKKVAIDSIRIDGGTQMRERINTDAVDDYAEAYTEGANMPPLDVFFDGKEYWLANGFHRYHAVRKVRWSEVDCIVHKGTLRDAVLFAASSNETNGLRRTRADKRTAVTLLLNDPEWKQWSDNVIAKAARVSQPFVGVCRKQVCLDAPIKNNVNSAKSAGRRKAKGGKSYPATRKPRKKVDLHVPPIDEDEPKSEPAKPAATPAKKLKAFDNERNLIRALADLATLIKQTRYTAEFDKGRLAHELNQWANDIAEQTEAAESAA